MFLTSSGSTRPFCAYMFVKNNAPIAVDSLYWRPNKPILLPIRLASILSLLFPSACSICSSLKKATHKSTAALVRMRKKPSTTLQSRTHLTSMGGFIHKSCCVFSNHRSHLSTFLRSLPRRMPLQALCRWIGRPPLQHFPHTMQALSRQLFAARLTGGSVLEIAFAISFQRQASEQTRTKVMPHRLQRESRSNASGGLACSSHHRDQPSPFVRTCL